MRITIVRGVDMSTLTDNGVFCTLRAAVVCSYSDLNVHRGPMLRNDCGARSPSSIAVVFNLEGGERRREVFGT